VSYRNFSTVLSVDSGFVYHWDKKSEAPYMYNAQKKWLVTFDDSASIVSKTRYAYKHHLNGIMFWQLTDDRFENGLLDVMDETKK
ncbi:glycosyl hydrolase family 18 protein, partial [Salmonella enterica]|uniref:glycosyl hydrolase family 18 protein n=1 Tax=Salmonella enterica TaxID=28901 RepID=UPI003D2CEA65